MARVPNRRTGRERCVDPVARGAVLAGVRGTVWERCSGLNESMHGCRALDGLRVPLSELTKCGCVSKSCSGGLHTGARCGAVGSTRHTRQVGEVTSMFKSRYPDAYSQDVPGLELRRTGLRRGMSICSVIRLRGRMYDPLDAGVEVGIRRRTVSQRSQETSSAYIAYRTTHKWKVLTLRRGNRHRSDGRVSPSLWIKDYAARNHLAK